MAMDTPPAIIEPQFDFNTSKDVCTKIRTTIPLISADTSCVRVVLDRRTGCTWLQERQSMTLYACPEKK